MKDSLEKFFYTAGTAFLTAAIIQLTFFAYIVNRYFPSNFLPQNEHVCIARWLYLAGFVFYLLSPKYYKAQIKTVFSLFLLYFIFRIIIKILQIVF